VAQAVNADQELGARLRPVPSRVHDERFRRRRERRGFLPAHRLHGGRDGQYRGPAAQDRDRGAAPDMRRRAAPVADGIAGPRADQRQGQHRGYAHRVRQGTHTQVPVDRRRWLQDGRGLLLQQRGGHSQHPSVVLLFEA